MSHIGPGLMGGFLTPPGEVDLDAQEAETVAIVAAYGTPPSNGRQNAINAFVVALKNASAWTHLKGLHIYAANDATGRLINWASPGTFNCTEVGTPTYTSDVGVAASAGNYLTTGFNPTTAGTPKFAQNDAFMAVAVMNDTNDTAAAYCCGNARAAINPRNSASLFRIYGCAATQDSAGTNTGKGLYSFSRTGSADFIPYKNGSALTTITRASTSLTNANFLVGTQDGSVMSNKTISLIAYGSALDATQQGVFFTAYAAYLTAIGQSAT